MKQFDIKKVKVGDICITRNGVDARIICTDFEDDFPVVAAIEKYGIKTIVTFTEKGREFDNGSISSLDLFIKPKIERRWVIIYLKDGRLTAGRVLHKTKEGAEGEGLTSPNYHCVKEIEIEL